GEIFAPGGQRSDRVGSACAGVGALILEELLHLRALGKERAGRLLDLAARDVVGVRRDSNGGENRDDGDRDHHLDESEACCAAHDASLYLECMLRKRRRRQQQRATVGGNRGPSGATRRTIAWNTSR